MTECPTCGLPLMRYDRSEFVTCVGYISPDGHNHDDNCRKRFYTCPNDHRINLSIINTCPACDWTGKKECFCSKKVEKWPND